MDENAVVVDGNTAQNALKSVSSDGHVLVFNTSDQRIVNLAAGQVLVLQDMGASDSPNPLAALVVTRALCTIKDVIRYRDQ